LARWHRVSAGHQYAEVDDTVVLTAWERLADFDSFVSQLSEWLAEQRA